MFWKPQRTETEFEVSQRISFFLVAVRILVRALEAEKIVPKQIQKNQGSIDRKSKIRFKSSSLNRDQMKYFAMGFANL